MRWTDVLRGFLRHPATNKLPELDGSLLPDQMPAMPTQNLLIWLLDGISRSYFMHNLPKTWAFLESLLEDQSGKGGFVLRGHNVVGINSNPNLVALWTGQWSTNVNAIL